VETPTALAVLLLWPLVGLALFLSRDALSATFWTLFGGFLFLPVKASIDFPLLPPIDKSTLPALVAILGLRLVKRKPVPLLPACNPQRILVVVLLVTPLLTVLTNQDAVATAERYIPGLSLHDAISMMVNAYLSLLPFMIGIALVRTPADAIRLARMLVLAGLAYSLLALFEIRMSPQLHTWLYGYFPHSFAQQIRFDGFRPVVFLGHGLLVSIFMAITLGFAALLWRIRSPLLPVPTSILLLYLALVLVLCKTVGAVVLAIAMVAPLMMLFPAGVLRVSRLIMIFVVGYPLISLLGLFPKAGLVELVAGFSPDRAESLAFRFYHEDLLLQRAMEKPLFGWGGWDRNRLDGSVTDGYWIIRLGVHGLIGFVAFFWLLLHPLLKRSALDSGAQERGDPMVVAGFSLLLAVLMVDQLPNASLAAPYVFLFGALAGLSQAPAREPPSQRSTAAEIAYGDAVDIRTK
jgi:hypothetical protein